VPFHFLKRCGLPGPRLLCDSSIAALTNANPSIR
jgi:hypothetical protein